ncbi:inositol polyphosphate kinase-like protein [Novymonas esmeraldas]|uniref:Kinase n=1 Tax=Novymonas esmeraldas TaxID=1808958 RepID=A0AAW0EQI6_9TRYP
MRNSFSRSTFDAVLDHSSTEEHRTSRRVSANASLTQRAPLPAPPCAMSVTSNTAAAAAAAAAADAAATAPPQSSCGERQPCDATTQEEPLVLMPLRSERLDARNSSDELDGYRSSCEQSLPGDSSSSNSTSKPPSTTSAEAARREHASGEPPQHHHHHHHHHRNHHHRYRGRGSPVRNAEREAERQQLVSMSFTDESAAAVRRAPSTDSVGTTATASPVVQTHEATATVAGRRFCAARTSSPMPITATTSTKTSLAMISAALNVESHSAAEASRRSASSSPGTASIAAAAGGSTSSAMLLRAPVSAASHGERDEDAGALRSPTASRLSRSSSGDSGGVEASVGHDVVEKSRSTAASQRGTPAACRSSPPANGEGAPPQQSDTHTNTAAAAAATGAAVVAVDAAETAHGGPSISAIPAPVLHTASATGALDVETRTSTNISGPRQDMVAAPAAPAHAAVDASSSSSVGGHHLSVTEGNAFLKQSGSRREEAFYNMIQPYQETLVREAVRQAPHTVEHWGHHRAGTPCAGTTDTAATSAAAAAAATAAAGGALHAPASAVARRCNSEDGGGVVADPDEVAAVCEARWEAYQQYEAEDMMNLHILASEQLVDGGAGRPPPHPRGSHVSAGTPVAQRPHQHDDDVESPPPSPHQVDKELVELAARLWWTVRFRNFYRTSAAAYEVQRQAAEVAGLAPPSPSAYSLAGTALLNSRCSTPVSLHPPSAPASPTPPTMNATAMEQWLLGHRSDGRHGGAAMAAGGSVSGTATPCMVGSFAAPSSEGLGSSASAGERQYAAQKHRALQLLAAFVPRYHGTRRLFAQDVLRCEREANAAAAAAAAATAAAATVVPSSTVEHENPLNGAQTRAPATTAAPSTAAESPAPPPPHHPQEGLVQPPQQPIVVDADDDDDGDDGDKRVCRMIMLEYVCYRFRRPCVMDIKMGSRQYGLHPSAEKKQSKERKSKLSTSARYGIRLAGYRRWSAEDAQYKFRSKLQCRCLTLSEVKGEIATFLLHSREMEHVFRRQLQRLRVAFSQQTVFRFFTSSLLFVYDAEDPLSTARVTMVDFAYTYESRELAQGGDPDADFAYDIGYLKAIDTLLSLLA